MDKAEKIRDDCRVLMSGEEGPTPAGCVSLLTRLLLRRRLTLLRAGILAHRVDILSATSSYLEQAYQKIFRWCCFEFRQMGRDATLEVEPSMREAVRRLRERPELVTYVHELRLSQWGTEHHDTVRLSRIYRRRGKTRCSRRLPMH